MKVPKFIFPLILLKFALLVSSDPDATELMKQLTDLVRKENSSAHEKILEQFDESLTKVTKLLSLNVVPAINEVYENLQDYIKALENQTLSSGYDVAKCTEPVKEALASGKLPNITLLAIREMEDIYDKMQSNVYSVGQQRIDVIAKEFDSISTEYVKCLLSGQAQYCNRTMPQRLSAKIDSFPLVFSNEVQKTNLAFIQEVVTYENRMQDYMQLAILTTKPYLSILESCVVATLVVEN